MSESCYVIRDGVDAGTYEDAQAAIDAKAQLYADFPDYLKMSNSSKVNVSNEVEFTYEVETTGTKPYLELKDLYEPFEEGVTTLIFEYKAAQDIENGRILFNTPNLMTEPIAELPTLEATTEWKTVEIDITQAIEALNFGSAVDHGIRWYINYNATADDQINVTARNFRFIKQDKNHGDLNGDEKIDIADAVTVLNIMASGEYSKDADVNKDNKVDIADFVTILNIMAAQ
jgi:hypothetical protein